jgi:hypothetical protein
MVPLTFGCVRQARVWHLYPPTGPHHPHARYAPLTLLSARSYYSYAIQTCGAPEGGRPRHTARSRFKPEPWMIFLVVQMVARFLQVGRYDCQ